MNDHANFILAAFAVSAAVIAFTIGWILLDHRRLKRALSHFPAREGDEA
jgi:heme exporter protein CcmD